MLDSIARDMEAPRECIEEYVKLNGLKPLTTIDFEEVRERYLSVRKDMIKWSSLVRLFTL